MKRCLFLAAALAVAPYICSQSRAAYRSAIIPQTNALQHGLKRSWFTQIQLDPAHGRVSHVVLRHGALYVQTNRALLHAIDAETGESLWAQQAGSPNHPSAVPGVSRDLVGTVNGSWLYILNRHNGKLLWKSQVDGAPGGGAALSEKRAFVPMVDGLVVAYRLEPILNPLAELGKTPKETTPEEKEAMEAERRESLQIRGDWVAPLACQSFGRAMIQPVVMRQDENEEFVAWPTDRGFLFVGRINRREEDKFTVRYRLETGARIVAQPTYLPPDPKVPDAAGVIFATSEDGFVYAIRDTDGQSLWRFSTGEPILQRAVVIGQRVFVAVQSGGMYCLAADTGAQQWWAPQVSQLIAVSKERLYVADKINRILVLDVNSGARLDTLLASSLPIRLTNTQTDRLYLATETGLIQCLHEVELTEPIHHDLRKGEAEKQPVVEQKGMEELKDKEEKKEEEPPADDPFAEKKPDDKPDEAQKDPFGGGQDDQKPADDNPFDQDNKDANPFD